jgi:hypothetical protein
MRSRECLLGLCLLLGYPFAPCQSTSSTQEHGDIAILVNPSNPVNGLSLSDLRRMLSGDRRFWQGNVQVKLVLPQPGTWEREEILSMVLKANNAEFNKGWLEKVFRGEAIDLPLSVASAAAAQQYLISSPGGITFMSAKEPPRQLKVVRLDGKMPGEAGYVLR